MLLPMQCIEAKRGAGQIQDDLFLRDAFRLIPEMILDEDVKVLVLGIV